MEHDAVLGVASARQRSGGASVPIAPFACAMGLSATLLFFVQPMMGKLLLPMLGGAPAVWNTCMLFFQTMLLAGYAYVHFGVRWLGVRRHAALHAFLVLVALAALPPAPPAWDPPTTGSPIPWLIAVLTTSVGLPFFVLSSTAPLVQRWFADSNHARAADPYFLYAASNLGSLAGLVLYPVVIEPALGLHTQASSWALGFAVFAVVLGTAGITAARRTSEITPTRTAGDRNAPQRRTPASITSPLRWTFCAFVPSALLLTVTTYITTDIAPVPLLWLVPLALYLATFVVAFGTESRRLLHTASWLHPLLLLSTGALLILRSHMPWSLPLHVAMFAICAYVAHAQLARERPEAERLTAFYLWVSFGGTLGGVFGAIVAPLLLSTQSEYFVLIVLACLARPAGSRPPNRVPIATSAALAALVLTLGARTLTPGGAWSLLSLMPPTLLVLVLLHQLRDRPANMAAVLALAFVAFAAIVPDTTHVIARERNFFGALAVEDDSDVRTLLHGRTVHGTQNIAVSQRREATTYYNRAGPLGDVFATLPASAPAPRIGAIGLGAGTVACYAQPHERWDFFEINPAIIRLAQDTMVFRFLHDCAPDARLIIGDARLSLQRMETARYRLLIIDAFSSDAIPVHLMTREALALYHARLTEHGVLAIHITNRYLELAPIVATHAAALGLTALMRRDADEQGTTRFASDWIALARDEADLSALRARPGWVPLEAEAGVRPWTDDYSNVLSALSVRRRLRD